VASRWPRCPTRVEAPLVFVACRHDGSRQGRRRLETARMSSRRSTATRRGLVPRLPLLHRLRPGPNSSAGPRSIRCRSRPPSTTRCATATSTKTTTSAKTSSPAGSNRQAICLANSWAPLTFGHHGRGGPSGLARQVWVNARRCPECRCDGCSVRGVFDLAAWSPVAHRTHPAGVCWRLSLLCGSEARSGVVEVAWHQLRRRHPL
jgi:hypothetical protein